MTRSYRTFSVIFYLVELLRVLRTFCGETGVLTFTYTSRCVILAALNLKGRIDSSVQSVIPHVLAYTVSLIASDGREDDFAWASETRV